MSLVQRYDGRYLKLNDAIYRVHGQDPHNPAYVVEDERGQISYISSTVFRDEMRRGNVSAGRTCEFTTFKPDSDQSREIAFRRAVLKDVAHYQSIGWNWERIMPALRERFQAHPEFALRAMNFPSKRAIQEWRARMLKKGSKALVDNRFNSGNRAPRYDTIFHEIVMDLLERSFMKSDRFTMTELVRQASSLYLSKCEDRGIAPGPHGRKAVEGIVEMIPHSDVLKGRLGSKEARKRLIQAAQFQDIRRAFDRVEVDSTRANIFVRIEGVEEPVRPWITIAVDAATGFIVGLFVSMDPPTSITTATVLREAMSGPDDGFFDRFGIENCVEVYGLPMTVVADQGPENSGEIIERLLKVTGLELQKNIPGMPQKKPFIERSNRTMKEFISTLPGTTQTREMPAKTRTEKAIDEAFMSFDQFVKAVQKWRFDAYAQKTRRRVQSPLKVRESPTEAWHRLSNESFVAEPPTKAELDSMFFCQKVSRRLHHYGIEVGRVQYWSPELGHFFSKHEVPEVDVWINPTDIRQVAVEYASGQDIFIVDAKDPDLPAISVEERDRILATIKKDDDSALTATDVLEAILADVHHRPITGKTKQTVATQKAQQQLRNEKIKPSSGKTRADIDLSGDMEPRLKVPRPQSQISIKKKNKGS